MNIKKTLTVGAISLISIVAYAQASQALSISVSGIAGTGSTTWTFSGSGTASSSGTIRDSSGSSYLPDDSSSFGTLGVSSFINDSSIQDQIFTATGETATITVGSDTANITSIYLDEDFSSSNGSNLDDFGIRVDSPLTFSSGESSRVTGSLTFALDVNQFNTGSFPPMFVADFASPAELSISATSAAVPFEFSPALGLVAVGSFFAGSRLLKRRKNITK